MQRGAGGSRSLGADDCSVTLIDGEEQVALRQATAGRPLRHRARRACGCFSSRALSAVLRHSVKPLSLVPLCTLLGASGPQGAAQSGDTGGISLNHPWCLWLPSAGVEQGERCLTLCLELYTLTGPGELLFIKTKQILKTWPRLVEKHLILSTSCSHGVCEGPRAPRDHPGIVMARSPPGAAVCSCGCWLQAACKAGPV